MTVPSPVGNRDAASSHAPTVSHQCPLGVPAGVDAEQVRSGVGCRVDERQELLGGRVAHEGVHVVVEHQGQGTVGLPHVPERPTLPGEHPEGVVDRRGDADGHRHRGERLLGCDDGGPLVFLVGGAAQQQVRVPPGLPELVQPRPVVLDLPDERVRKRHSVLPPQHPDRQRFTGRPRAAVLHDGAAAGRVVLGLPVDRCEPDVT
ncbi:hypothetical protein MKU73_12745 [Curtobacterium flaccumfaciens pv. betae]|uniref:hypothetical protein n=1 Tax=Curtobacterium flaccumfaciens TaxID=2035 RepID=UPI001BDE36B7|nr:hypothetical protein [Curtobacterium flaccumfaciens]MBT1607886.1 hypothetical protein [Curtobacterium flaccumfaciens pv. betae]MBT1657864.1 hypothetical protein [Curtobacterium flaccumfaciens pv. betae]MCS0470195.1 hypothetical protein [Curtobacterium flaccumfaciens pv. betae]MCS0481000.1 hypothetical protein [Curtobacterium flaccumfaciens pv. betae]MCS0483177.1 hypothetical protein [Curtobacterium flaccumfaciens pv. betae]